MKYVPYENHLKAAAEGGLEGDRKALHYVPHDYQTFATEFILSHPVAAILLQMGLGKSVITLTAIRELLDRGEVRKVLVIAPLRVARDTWPEEIRKWDHLQGLTFAVAVGTPAERMAALTADCDVCVINRENVPWLIEQSGIPFDWDMIVIDELSSFKNGQAKRFRSLLKVRPLVKRIVGLTGTPTPNGYMDLFAEYRLLDMGERLGRFITRYREQYFVPDRWGNGQIYSWKLRNGAKAVIDRKISDITVSMKSVDYLKMPEVIYNRVPVYMNGDETALYEELKEQMVLEVFSKPKKAAVGERNKGTVFPVPCSAGTEEPSPTFRPNSSEVLTIDAKNAAVLCGKLAQMAGGAIYTEDHDVVHIHDRKLDALEDLIEGANGNPLLIAYWYQHDIQRIRGRFPDVWVLKTPQDMADWNAGRIPVAAIHPASAGHGLNLQTGGSTLVWYGLTWSLELYQQTNARLWRQGQQAETVVIHHIVTENTIDEQILQALEKKDRSQESLIDAVKAQLTKRPQSIREAEGGLEGDRKASQGGAA